MLRLIIFLLLLHSFFSTRLSLILYSGHLQIILSFELPLIQLIHLLHLFTLELFLPLRTVLLSDRINLLILLLLLLPPLFLRKLLRLILDLQKRVIREASLQNLPSGGPFRSGADQTSGLLRFEERVFPLLAFGLAQEGRLLDLEEGVPRYLLLEHHKQVVAAFLAGRQLY